MDENFNYISITRRDYIKDDMEVFRSRMFEFTPVDIEKRLEPLNMGAITFLKELPTFVCSEIEVDEANRSMIIKFGKITKLEASENHVSITFETLIDFGEVKFKKDDEPAKIFDVDRIQLYRGHWAVRDGDASDVLKRLAEFDPDFSKNIDKINTQDTFVKEHKLPPRDKKNMGIADSVTSFLSLLSALSVEAETDTFFRGHSDANYELTPSLLRKWENGDWQFMQNEDRLCKELLIAHYDEFQSDQYCFDRLVRMQHYGLPTRMLDISGNPLVALFFACLSDTATEGEVIIFQMTSDSVKYYDSDTVSCLSNLSNLTYEQKKKIDIGLDPKAFNKTEVVEKLLHHIMSEKGFFEGRIVPSDLGSIICVKAKQTNSRIKSQSGAFLLFGNEATLPDAGKDGVKISRITIKEEEKKNILDELDRINVNHATVYPSIDQTADHLREKYQSQKPVK
jgi:hypothetical protein